MAIIEAVPHVSARVIVNGTPLLEFDDDDDAGDGDNNSTANSITKYVEVTSGQSFSIQYRMEPAFIPKHDFCVTIYIDGKYGDSHVHRATNVVHLTRTFEGNRESTSAGQFLRKFIFSEVTTSKYRPMEYLTRL